jgi:hypothetical protein
MKKLYLVLLVTIFVACVSLQYQVKRMDDRSSSSKGETYVGENNRILKKSVAGGIHYGKKSIFFDPSVN